MYNLSADLPEGVRRQDLGADIAVTQLVHDDGHGRPDEQQGERDQPTPQHGHITLQRQPRVEQWKGRKEVMGKETFVSFVHNLQSEK